MKKYTYIILILLILGFNVSKTQAQDATQFSKNILSREDIKQKINDLRNKIKNEKNLVKLKNKENILNNREILLNNFNNTIDKIDTLKEKLWIEITKFETRGTDVNDSKNILLSTNTKIDLIKNETYEINILFTNSLNELSVDEKNRTTILTKDIQNNTEEIKNNFNKIIKILKNYTQDILPSQTISD